MCPPVPVSLQVYIVVGTFQGGGGSEVDWLFEQDFPIQETIHSLVRDQRTLRELGNHCL